MITDYDVCCEHPLYIRNPQYFDLVMSMDYLIYNGREVIITPSRRSRIFDGESFYKVFNIYYKADPDKSFRDKSFFLRSDGLSVPFFLSVPCNKCDACRSKYVAGLRQRAVFESELSSGDVLFVTLTYNQSHHPVDGLPSKRDVQLFKKRLSQLCRVRYNVNLKFFCFSEFHKSGLVHYHMLIYHFPDFRMLDSIEQAYKTLHIMYCWREPERVGSHYLSFVDYVSRNPKVYDIRVTDPDYDSRSYGFVNLKVVNSKGAAGYVSKYVTKHCDDKRLFSLVSQNLGVEFAKKYIGYAATTPDRSFSYVSRVDGSLCTTSLNSYFLKKLMPSQSVLFPVDVRRYIHDVRYICTQLSYNPYLRGDIRSRVAGVLEDLDLSFPDFPSRPFARTNFFKLIDDEKTQSNLVDTFVRLVDDRICYLNSYKALKIDTKILVDRDAYFMAMLYTSRQYAAVKALKFRKERSKLIASSYL